MRSYPPKSGFVQIELMHALFFADASTRAGHRTGFYARVDLTPPAEADHALRFRNWIHKLPDGGQSVGIFDDRLPKAAGGKAMAILRIRKNLAAHEFLPILMHCMKCHLAS